MPERPDEGIPTLESFGATRWGSAVIGAIGDLDIAAVFLIVVVITMVCRVILPRSSLGRSPIDLVDLAHPSSRGGNKSRRQAPGSEKGCRAVHSVRSETAPSSSRTPRTIPR